MNDLISTFAKVQREGFFPCPRCGQLTMDPDDVLRNALSRHADIYICDECGTDEAMRDFVGCVLPIEEWAISINPENYIR